MKKFTLNVLMVALILFSAGKASAQSDTVDLTPFSDPNVLLDTLDGLSGGEIVLLMPGMTYNAGGFAFVNSVTIQSSDMTSWDFPKIDCSSNYNYGDGAMVDSIVFRHLEFLGGYDSRYVINSNVSVDSIGMVMFDECYIHELRGVHRMKDNGPGVLNQLVIQNSMVARIRDYGILTVDRDDWRCNHIIFQNSTITHARSFLTSRNVSTSILIDGCILNATPSTGREMFRWRTGGQDTITDGITVRNTLWGPGWDENGVDSTAYDAYAGLASTPWTFENTWITSDLDIAAGKDSIEGANFVYPGLSTDLWVESSDWDALDFAFADTAFAGIGNAGHQLWGVAADSGGWEVNISHPAFNALGTLDTTAMVAGLKVYANSGKTVTIDDNNKSLDGMDFTQRLKLGGGGDFDDNGMPRGRVLEINLFHSSRVTVAAMSSSSGSDRVLNLAYGNKDTLLGAFPALGASLTGADYDYYGNGTKLWLYSPSSGVNVYYLKVASIQNIDATLSSLSASIGDLDPAFDPEVTSYSVEYPNGTSLITVTASLSDPNASMVIASGGTVDVSGGPTSDTITVTAEDSTVMMQYIIEFNEVYIPNDDATLSGLTVDSGELFPAFSTGNQSYTVDLPFGVSEVTVGATSTDPNASVDGTGAVDVSAGGTIQHDVVCTAEDGTTAMTYTIDFISHVGVEEAHPNSMSVYPTISKGTFNVEFARTPGLITVYDLTGRRVLERNAASSVETIKLDKQGIYLIYLESENEFNVSRVIVVK